MERVKGIEPSYEAWEAAVLPLNYTRICGRAKRRLGLRNLQVCRLGGAILSRFVARPGMQGGAGLRCRRIARCSAFLGVT